MMRHHKDGQRRFSDGGRRGSSLGVGGGYKNVQKGSVKMRFSRKEADRLACRTSRATRRENDEGKNSSMRTGNEELGRPAKWPIPISSGRVGRASERYWSLGLPMPGAWSRVAVFFC